MKNKKAKAKTSTILMIILGLLIVGFVVGKSGIIYSITGQETMTRTSSVTTVNPSSTFQVCYTATGVSGLWGVSFLDTISGGCTKSGSTEIKGVMVSDDADAPGPRCATVTSPSSGSCTFTGNYKYGTSPTLNFAPLTVTVCSPTCTRPANLCLTSSSDGCGGTCTWTVTKNTNADTNCNNIVDRTELGVYINGWIAGTVTRDNLGVAIVAWIGTG